MFFLQSASVAGGSPAASYLFCFAKKGNPKKATAQPLPFGFPFVPSKKWETGETRLRLRQRPFLFPFLRVTNGSATAEEQLARLAFGIAEGETMTSMN